MSGRCKELEGTNGAYNIFESESRMNTVVSQLSKVIESLEQIKGNQFVLYDAIDRSNKELKKLNTSMNHVVDTLNSMDKHIANIDDKSSDIKRNTSTTAFNSGIIAYNTEVAAFYAKKNAELTNALGYLVALS